jgi:hypothetical protein
LSRRCEEILFFGTAIGGEIVAAAGGRAGVSMRPMPAAIHVDRQAGGYTDRARAYKVLVDSEERGTVKQGEGVEIEVEPGSHEVQVRIDWAGSRTLEVDLTEG